MTAAGTRLTRDSLLALSHAINASTVLKLRYLRLYAKIAMVNRGAPRPLESANGLHCTLYRRESPCQNIAKTYGAETDDHDVLMILTL